MGKKFSIHYHVEGNSLPYKHMSVETNSIESFISEMRKDKKVTILEHYEE